MDRFDWYKKVAKNVSFIPSPIQEKILADNNRFITWLSGARSGKSMLSGFLALCEVLLPGKNIWIVAPSYDLAKKEFDHTISFLQKFSIPDSNESLLDLAELSVPCEGSCKISFSWGSSIETKSTDNPISLLGVELDLLILAEASCIHRNVYDRYLRARLGSRVGRQLAFSTGSGDSGLFADFVNNGRRLLSGWSTYESSTLSNPYFNKEEYELSRQQLDAKTFAEQFEGKLVSFRGLVFDISEEMENPIIDLTPEQFEYIKTLPIFVGIKYNINNVTPITILAYDKSSRVFYTLLDMEKKESILPEIVEGLNEKLKGFKVVAYVVDAWDYETYERLSVLSCPVCKVEQEKKLGKTKATIFRARNLLTLFREGRFKISSKCQNTIKELSKCTWPNPKKEGSDLLEGEIPLPKFFQFLYVSSGIISFLEL